MTQGPAGPVAAMELATLRRRLISLTYETLLLVAVLLAGALPAVVLTQGWAHSRVALQIWLILVSGCFYVRQWSGAGQTLPMKTWRMRLLAQDGTAVKPPRAWARYAAATLSVALLGLGFLWALVDRERQFLHDRLAGTRLTVTPR